MQFSKNDELTYASVLPFQPDVKTQLVDRRTFLFQSWNRYDQRKVI